MSTARFSSSLLGLVWLLELARMAHEATALLALEMAALAIFSALAWFRASWHLRVLFAVIVLACAAISAWLGSAGGMLSGLTRALVFGAFIPAIVMLRATVESSPRIGRMRQGLERVDDRAAELLTLHASHGLGGIINVGAAAVLAPVVAQSADEETRERLASASARGIAIAAMWSPFYLSVAFTAQLAPSVPVWQVIALGLATAVPGFVLAYFWFTPGAAGMIGACMAALGPLAGPTAVMVGAVVGASLAFGWSGLHAVAIVIPALCVGYATTLGRARDTIRSTFTMMGRVSNELLIVLSSTLLGSVVASLPAVQGLGASVTPDLISGPAILAALAALMLVLGQLGVHPMITSSILVPVICIGNFGVCDAIAVATAVFAWAVNATISIWTIPMAVTASTFGLPVGRLVTLRNVAFSMTYAVLGVALLASVNEALLEAGCH